MNVRKMTDPQEKQAIARQVLEALPEWFGISQAREDYIQEAGELPFLAAYWGEEPIGFLCWKATGKATVELTVMGVRKEHHRQGAGRALFQVAKEDARAQGYRFFQVKTVQIGRYPQYDETNYFYQSLGFQEFEVFPTLWDKANPCQVYVMAL